MVPKQLKIHENDKSTEDLIKSNYPIKKLYHPNIRPLNRELINNAVRDFEPYFDKIKFTQMLFADDAGHLNFTDLLQIFRKIKR